MWVRYRRMSGLSMQPFSAAGPYGFHQIGSTSLTRAPRLRRAAGFCDPVSLTVSPTSFAVLPAPGWDLRRRVPRCPVFVMFVPDRPYSATAPSTFGAR